MSLTNLPPELLLLVGVMALMGAVALGSGRGILEFPGLAGLFGVAWVLPQALEMGAAGQNAQVSNAFWVYAALCFAAIVPGFSAGVRVGDTVIERHRASNALQRNSYDASRLIIAAGCLTAFGLVNKLLVGGVDTSKMGSGWTGVVTMYVLFEDAASFGLCLSMLIFAHTKSRVALLIAAISAAPSFYNVMTGARRESLFELLALSGGAFYLARNKFPPRILVCVGLVFGSVVLNRIGEIRAFISEGRGDFADAMMSEELYKGFDYFSLDQGRASELGLARADFDRFNASGEVEFGASYWNALVSQYVPAFVFGRGFKDALMLDTLDRKVGERGGDVAFSFGSTRTGFSDTFRSFGWLGVAVFAALGHLFGRLYAWARVGGIREQYYYLILMGSGLKAITHSTSEFVSALPFAVTISVLVFAYARRGALRSWFPHMQRSEGQL